MKIILSLLLTALFTLSLYAQNNVEQQIIEIRKEFKKINSELENYVKKVSVEEVKYYFEDLDSPIIHGCETFGYFNEKNELVLLTSEYSGEEQYWHNYQYYFKDGKVFFMFIGEGVHGEDSQERIYFYDNKIIKALIKRRIYEDNDVFKDFKDIKNEPYNDVMDNPEEQSSKYLSLVQELIDKFYSGLGLN